MDDEGWHADCREDGPHVQFEHERHHESYSRGAGRQAFVSGPRCPDLLVPRHVRIDYMLNLAGAPHIDHGGVPFLAIEPVSALSASLRIGALKHDQRSCARRMCGGEQPRCRERAGNRHERRFAAL